MDLFRAMERLDLTSIVIAIVGSMGVFLTAIAAAVKGGVLSLSKYQDRELENSTRLQNKADELEKIIREKLQAEIEIERKARLMVEEQQEKEMAELRHQIRGLEAQINQILGENNLLKEKDREKSEKLAEANRTIGMKDAGIETLATENRTQGDLIKALREEIDQVKRQRDTLQAENEEKDRQLGVLHVLYDSTQEERNSLRIAIRELQTVKFGLPPTPEETGDKEATKDLSEAS